MKIKIGRPAAALKTAQGSSRVMAPIGEAKRIAGPKKAGAGGNAFSLSGGTKALASHCSTSIHKV